jgi:hypothetical protein
MKKFMMLGVIVFGLLSLDNGLLGQKRSSKYEELLAKQRQRAEEKILLSFPEISALPSRDVLDNVIDFYFKLESLQSYLSTGSRDTFSIIEFEEKLNEAKEKTQMIIRSLENLKIGEKLASKLNAISRLLQEITSETNLDTKYKKAQEAVSLLTR